MNLKNKLMVIILIILVMISSCSVVFGRYILESEKTELANINIKTCDFTINDLSKYGTFDLYLDGQKVSSSISSFNRKLTIGTTYEIKNIKINSGYVLETDSNSLKGTVSNTTTINLSFSTISYTISYTLNGGSITGENKTYTVETDSFTLPTPTKNGYTFTGWTGTGVSSATKTVTVSKGSTGNKSYTANWTPTNYSISYSLNGGSIIGQKTSYNIETDSFTLPTPTRNGYTFTGWTGTGLSSATKTVTISKGNTGDKSYTANWTPINYTISYNVNGGAISGQKTSYNIETASFNLVTPTKNGYTFTGWTGTGLSSATKTVTISKGSTGNRSYTANWTPTNYTISYNTNGGSISGQKTSYNIETASFNLVTPTRNGYTFAGWTGTGLSSATNTVTISKGSTGNKSYTANWTPINYNISYNANGGYISGQRTSYNIETASFNLVTPSRTGYTFTGWTGTGLSGATKTVTVSKGSTGDRSYTANWVDDIKPTIHGAWITSGPTYEVRSTGYGYRVNIQVSCSDSGSGINRVLTYYDLNGGWTGETNITGSMTDSFWFKPGYRKIRIVVFDNAGNSSETTIAVQCG